MMLGILPALSQQIVHIHFQTLNQTASISQDYSAATLSIQMDPNVHKVQYLRAKTNRERCAKRV